MNSDHCTETLRSLNAHFQVHPTRKVSEILLFHNNTRMYTSVCMTDVITNSGWTLLLHPSYSPDLVPSHYHLFGTKKKPVTTQLHQ